MKLFIASVGIVSVTLILVALLVGGGSGDPDAFGRRGTIPTATQPANLPEPIVLGSSRGGLDLPSGGGSGASTYVVRSGDTISAIAARFGVPTEEQAAWIAETLRLNGIADARLLSAGVEIRLPAVPAAAPPAPTATTAVAVDTSTPPPIAEAPTATPTLPVTGGGGSYTVVEGDNPTIIAEKLGLPPEAVAAWANELILLNGIDPTLLFIGQVLELPAGTPSPPAPTPVP
jgi:LysM repeat protein